MNKGQLVRWDCNPKQTYEVIYLYSDQALIVRMSKDGYPIVHDVKLTELKAKAVTA